MNSRFIDVIFLTESTKNLTLNDMNIDVDKASVENVVVNQAKQDKLFENRMSHVDDKLENFGFVIK